MNVLKKIIAIFLLSVIVLITALIGAETSEGQEVILPTDLSDVEEAAEALAQVPDCEWPLVFDLAFQVRESDEGL